MPNTTRQTPAKLPRERDRDGKRFCRMCDDYLPLAAFPAGQRRYACRTHLWQRVGRPAKRKMLAKPQKRLLSRLWMQCYKDRLVFGHARVELTQAELAGLLEAAAAGDNASASELAVLPKDPRMPLSLGNAVLASREARAKMLARARLDANAETSVPTPC
jgi:hypothetical protein